MRRIRTARLLLPLLCCACSALPSCRTPQEPTKESPAVTADPIWPLWKSWDTKAREAFMDGYLTGHAMGNDDGCVNARMALTDLPELQRLPEATMNKIGERCYARRETYHLPVDTYVRVINELSERYPEDKAYPFETVLVFLADQTDSKKTVVGIHKALHFAEAH